MPAHDALRLQVDSYDADQAIRFLLAARNRRPLTTLQLIDGALASIRAKEPGWIDVFESSGTIVVVAGARLVALCAALLEGEW